MIAYKVFRALFTILSGLLLITVQVYAQGESLGFLVNEDSNSITVVDPADNHVVGVIALDGILNKPHSAVFDSASQLLYVSNKGANITVLDMTDVLAPEVVVNFNPGGTGEIHTVVIAGDLVWFAHLGDSSVYAYDLVDLSAPQFVFDTESGLNSAHGLAVRPGSHELWVTNRPKDAPGFILRIDTESHTIIGDPLPTTGNVGDQPNNIAFTPDGQFAYVVNAGDLATEVTVIDATNFTIVTQIIQDEIQGLSPHGIAYDPVNNMMFVSNKNSTTVSTIDLCDNSVVAYIEVGATPQLVTQGPNGLMYVPVKDGNKLVVIDPDTLEVTAELADDASFSNPHFITFSNVPSEDELEEVHCH